ncbi:NgoFVII family restriction endonuclease [soil metagenome]
MTISDLYAHVLINPSSAEGIDELVVLSGYANATLAYRHLAEVLAVNPALRVRLYVGMCARDGISRNNHANFKRLSVEDKPLNFSCYYTRSIVHAKIFVWLRDGQPVSAFTGSANYTQNGFVNDEQKEVMTSCDAQASIGIINALTVDAVDCRAQNIDAIFNIFELEEAIEIRNRVQLNEVPVVAEPVVPFPLVDFETITVSLLDNAGQMPARSGLNWGQRERREPNQAYIRIPAAVYSTNFFPPIGIRFTLLTDDDQSFICTRAQANGKAIETPHNNSILGRYFRQRLGLAPGTFVSLEAAQGHGRTSVEFYKIDDETYFMDFSVE